MTRRAAIIWVWGLVLIAGAIGGGFLWWRQQDLAQAYEAGRALADSQKWEEVLVLAQPYAGRDDPRINGLLADAYINGPDSIRDIDKGLTLRRRAAEAGDMRAAYFMGKWILEHEPTDAQAKEAIGYLQEAADCGMPAANFELGWVYQAEAFNLQDYVKSYEYYQNAAKRDYKNAAWNASIMHSKIMKLEGMANKDVDIAGMRWLIIAAKNGDTNAQISLEALTQNSELKYGAEGLDQMRIFEIIAIQWKKDNVFPLDGFSCGQ